MITNVLTVKSQYAIYTNPYTTDRHVMDFDSGDSLFFLNISLYWESKHLDKTVVFDGSETVIPIVLTFQHR